MCVRHRVLTIRFTSGGSRDDSMDAWDELKTWGDEADSMLWEMAANVSARLNEVNQNRNEARSPPIAKSVYLELVQTSKVLFHYWHLSMERFCESKFYYLKEAIHLMDALAGLRQCTCTHIVDISRRQIEKYHEIRLHVDNHDTVCRPAVLLPST